MFSPRETTTGARPAVPKGNGYLSVRRRRPSVERADSAVYLAEQGIDVRRDFLVGQLAVSVDDLGIRNVLLTEGITGIARRAGDQERDVVPIAPFAQELLVGRTAVAPPLGGEADE